MSDLIEKGISFDRSVHGKYSFDNTTGSLVVKAYPALGDVVLDYGEWKAFISRDEAIAGASSLMSKSVTDDHPFDPREGPVMIKLDNNLKYHKGLVSEVLSYDEDKKGIETELLIQDPYLVDQVLKNKKVELSCGYYRDRLYSPGSFDGEDYEYIFKNIQHNHVAVVKKGRAKKARISLDGYGISFDNKKPNYEKNMKIKSRSIKKIEVGDFSLDAFDISFPESESSNIEILEKSYDQATSKLESLYKSLQTEKGKTITLQAQVEDLQTKVDQSSSFDSSLDLALEAMTFGIKREDMKGKSSTEIKRMVLKKTSPGFDKIESSMDDAQVEGAYIITMGNPNYAKKVAGVNSKIKHLQDKGVTPSLIHQSFFSQDQEEEGKASSLNQVIQDKIQKRYDNSRFKEEK